MLARAPSPSCRTLRCGDAFRSGSSGIGPHRVPEPGAMWSAHHGGWATGLSPTGRGCHGQALPAAGAELVCRPHCCPVNSVGPAHVSHHLTLRGRQSPPLRAVGHHYSDRAVHRSNIRRGPGRARGQDGRGASRPAVGSKRPLGQPRAPVRPPAAGRQVRSGPRNGQDRCRGAPLFTSLDSRRRADRALHGGGGHGTRKGSGQRHTQAAAPATGAPIPVGAAEGSGVGPTHGILAE